MSKSGICISIRKKYILILVGLMFTGVARVFCQTSANLVFNVNIPVISLVDIESVSGNNISFSIPQPNEAGQAIGQNVLTNNNLWMNYTSSKIAGNTRNIKVNLLGAVPAGLELSVEAMNYTGSGGGIAGNPSGKVVLNSTPKLLVSGINGCYTGNGVGNGHRLVYTLTVIPNDYALLTSFSNQTVSIIYTISDN